MSYPEHEKLKSVKDLSQAQGAFLEWLQEQGYVLCKKSRSGDLWPAAPSLTNLLADYHGIDLIVLEQEKRQMIDELRRAAQCT